jgi:2-polyprenyl-3-methyl-5-hydroxy-6-metoxy-1,4-benzoquinol methylase
VRTHGNAQKHESGNPIQRRLIGGFHEQVVSYVRRVAPRTILEIGCGEGYVLAALQEAGVDAHLIGVDLAAEAVEAARGRVRPPAELHVGDARDAETSFAAAEPDLVMMLEVLEHLEEPEAMLSDLTRLVSGHLLLSVPREPLFRGLNLARLKHVRALGNDPEHLNHWGSRAFTDLVGRHFEVVATSRPLPWTLVLARPR